MANRFIIVFWSGIHLQDVKNSVKILHGQERNSDVTFFSIALYNNTSAKV